MRLDEPRPPHRPRVGFAEAANILALWATKRRSTWDIAQELRLHEADVERVIHTDREVKRIAQ